MDKMFLDANVLFSAAYMEGSRLLELFSLPDTALVTSAFAYEEAHRNLTLHRPEALPRLDDLSEKLVIINSQFTSLPPGINLVDKDAPILTAAISAKCTHLITGDNQHFGPLYGSSIEGVCILTPSQYLKTRQT